MDQLQRQKQILTSEIRILEKQKTDINLELEHLSLAKSTEFTQYQKQIKDLSDKRAQLIEQVEQCKEQLELLTSNYKAAKQSLQEFKTEQLAETKTQLEKAKSEAKTITNEANSALESALQLKMENEVKQQRLETLERELLSKGQELTDLSVSLSKRQEELKRVSLETETELLAKRDEVAKLSGEIITLESKRDALSQVLAEQKQQHASETELMKQSWQQLTQKSHALANQEDLLVALEEKLKQEQRRLKDQRATLDRAVAEMRQKGAQI